MAKFKGKLSLSTINSLKGFLDFYTRGDETIVRTWPKNRGKSQTPASIPWQRVFANFMECYGSFTLGGPIFVPSSISGKEWSSRDYLMSTYYGKMQMPEGWTYDTRPPWPPPIPDPRDRLFVIGPPRGFFGALSGVVLLWKRCPQGQTHIYRTLDPPRYHRKAFYIRRQKHVEITQFTPQNGIYVGTSAQRGDFGPFNQRTFFFVNLNTRYYFLMITGNPFGHFHVSQSPWFVLSVKPGPGGGEVGATIQGPVLLTPYMLDHPDRPIV